MSSSPTEALAILSMACRLPGADTPEAFWQNLAAGIESVQQVPPARWSIDQLFAPPPYQPGKSISRWGAFLDDIQRFDAAFFNIPAEEAHVMDPQQRILLELAYTTLERSGYRGERRAGLRIGVFLGIGQNGYSELTIPHLLANQPTHPMLVAHNIRNLIAGQIAHSLNLTGPALVIDTACSSSLVALHMARQSLLGGDCDLALVGGINLNITPTPFVAFSSAGVLAATPHTFAFDERADGFVLGEGGGMILLSVLNRAITNQDPILAVVRGSAINNDGRSLGAMTPSPTGQEAVLRAAYSSAAIDPATVSYIEAHGTGTRIGDVVEARALTRFFRDAPTIGPRYLGTVKPNIGHLLSAAGMPSLIKVLLAFQHRQLPPTLHCEQVRPSLKLQQAGFTLNQTLLDWVAPIADQPLRAGVSGFGFGGTNAHILLEEAPRASTQGLHVVQPTHHFARTRFWVETLPTPMPVPSPSQSTGMITLPVADPAIDDWFQRVVWQATPLSPQPTTVASRSWLILSADAPAAQQLATALVDHLQIQGIDCTQPPGSLQDNDQLDKLLAQNEARWEIVLIGPVGPAQPLDHRDALDAGLAQGILTLHALARRILSLPLAQRPLGLWVITAGAYTVAQATDESAPDRAALAGLAFALHSESSDMPCMVVDLPPTANLATQLSLLSVELSAAPTSCVRAWRRVDGRWTRFTRQLASLPATQTVRTHLRQGTYLITGGASGIGAAIARGLAEQGHTLILTGRTPLMRSPERAALVTTLRKLGAIVDYLVADVTQAAEVAALFDYIEQLYGAPTGVIHAAGIVQPQALRNKSSADFQAVVAPKIIGAWLLAQALAQRAIHPDCFVLFSSIASVLPGMSGGLSDYTAANAFLDALATTERRRGIACTVINWAAWAATGMGAQPLLLQRLADHGLAGIETEEGVRAFYRALALDIEQVVILKPSVSTALAIPATRQPPPATLPASESIAIERTLQTLLAAVLKVEPATVSTQASFMSLGIDSMDALDLVLKLEQAGFGGLPATLFFEYQTIADLARHLASQPPSPTPEPTYLHADDIVAPTTFPLSSIQQAFAINQYLYPTRPAVAFLRQTMHGEIQLDQLQQAVAAVAARHPLLRARFSITDMATEQLQQTIYPADELGTIPPIEVVGPVDAAALAHLETNSITRPFDLAHGSPWRIVLARDASDPNGWHLLLAIHHIAGDAWSLSLVAHELWTLYTARVKQRAPDLPLPEGTFQAYIAAQEPSTQGATQAWWRQQISNYTAALPIRLPFDRDPNQFTQDDWETMQPAAQATRLTPELTAALTQLAAQQELSLFHLLLATYLRCLQQWSNLPYLIINVADAQRPTQPPGLMEVVGSFADTLPLGLAVAPNATVIELGQRIRQLWLEIQQHKTLSSLDLARLLAEGKPNPDSAQPRTFSPLGFSLARFAAKPPVDCPLDVIDLWGRTATATMRLTLVGWELNGALGFSWNYLTPLFHTETVRALADNFVHELTALVAMNAETPPDLDDVPPLVFMPVHAQVQAQCQRTPDALAVWDHDAALTYGELDQRSNQVAAALYAHGVAAGDRIGVLAQPAADAIILLLGIAKANAVWVPLDPAHPPARHADQLGQAEVRLLLFPDALLESAAALRDALPSTVHLLSLTTLCQSSTGEPPSVHTTPEMLAYIIFTSGSTGRPKGVPITHGALANYMGWAVETFGYGPTDRVMQATSLCFDASIRQILAPLITGGTVVPVDRDTVNDADALLQFVQQTALTIWSSAPALWGRLLGAIEKRLTNEPMPPPLPHLRWIQVGGEGLSAQLVRRWFDLYGSQQQIVNLYGPTETTINAAYYLVPSRPDADAVQIPIGYPVRGARLQVRDEAGLPCPPSAPGELYIGGISVSPGYLHDYAQTDKHFVTDATGQRFYRSGDRVQQRGDGALLFLGRLDEQVKVRGYRIELGEIEAVLSQHKGVRLSAVQTRQRAVNLAEDEQEIVAYIECFAPPPTETELRQWARTKLPGYMIPHHFYQRDRLPLTPNGKIDRQALAAGSAETQLLPLAQLSEQSSEAPRTPTEQLLAQIWRTVLGQAETARPIGRADDFFALGGDSLQAIRVFAELEKQRTPLPRATYLYRYRTLATLAQALDDYRPEPQPTTPAASGDHFGITLAQAGFLLLRAGRTDQATSWCARFALEGILDIDCFTQAVQLLMARHLMLRVVFPPAASSGVGTARTRQQRELHPDQPMPVTFEDLQPLPDEAARQAILDERWHTLQTRQFDPTQWPLIEMRICRVTPTDHVWFVATDHLIGDGWSGWLLGQELLQLHDALVHSQPMHLPALRSTFRDYVTLHHQQERSSDPAAEHYWRETFATPYQAPILKQGAAKAPSGPLSARPDWLQQSLDFDADLVQRLEAYAANANVTSYELLLTLFLRQLRQLTGQSDLVVGSALAGRDEALPDIMHIFGAFATVLPLRVQLASDNWSAQLQQVANAFSQARAHTLSPRRIAQLLPPQTSVTAAIGAQFLFSYMDFTLLGEVRSDTLRVRWQDSQTELQPPGSGTDLVLTARKIEGQLRLFFTCSIQGLDSTALHRFVRGFAQALHQQVEPSAPSAIRFTSRPLAENHSDQAVAALDTALIGYLPPFAQIQRVLGALGGQLDAHAVRRLLFPDGQARWLERLETRLGTSGLIAIPWFADELAALPSEQLCRAVQQARQQATALGVRGVALAGMLPAHTRYGYALLAAEPTAPHPLTTGHSTTVVAVVKTVLAALAATGQTLATIEVGCLGLGSIGSAVMQLLLQTTGHPASLTLCDVQGSAARLQALATTLRQEFDYQGSVRIIEVADTLIPTAFYTANLIIGATSQPNLLDVAQLAPGTVVVDDSFPACFDMESALARMTTAQDVLLVGGGLLHCGAIQRTVYLPLPSDALGARLVGQILPDAIASCQLEALLWVNRPTLPLTQGVATLAGARAYWAAAAELDITAAPLHLHDLRINAELLSRIRQIRQTG